MVATVDDEDFDLVNQYRWRAEHHRYTWYAMSGRARRMHTLITGFTQTDHVNGNGLDNRRENLREATNAENRRNQQKQTKRLTSSQYKGVTYNHSCHKWQAQIKVDGKKKYLGVFALEVDAALAYDVAARQYFGVFARPNFS